MVYYTKEYRQSFTSTDLARKKIRDYIAENNKAFESARLDVKLKLHCTPQEISVSDNKEDDPSKRLEDFTKAKRGDVKYLLQSADIAVLMTKNGVSQG